MRLTVFSIPALMPGLFRLRYWASKNVAINNRIGFSTTLLVEPVTIRNALALPLTAKNHGRHQGQMIALVAPRFAWGPAGRSRGR